MIVQTRLFVIKRDGKRVPFDLNRIVRAISLAVYATRISDKNNPCRSDPDRCFGLPEDLYARCLEIANGVQDAIVAQHGPNAESGVEQVQDLVQIGLGRAEMYDVLIRFMQYRVAHAELRPIHHEENGMQEWVAISRYARFSEKLGRREVWTEAVDRVRDMHVRRFASLLDALPGDNIERLVAAGVIDNETRNVLGSFGTLSEEIDLAFNLVKAKKALPSMRSLQFGGPAIEAHEAKIYNCTASPVNRVEFFKEYFYLLLCGTGCGFSVQKHHVACLPALAQRGDELDLTVVHFEVADTIEGWANALHKLIHSYVKGYKVEFSYKLIRPRGAPLKTAGGIAPGHLPLKRALDKVEAILAGAAGRQLRPIEVYDINMHVAVSVLSGGVRRSATICLFSADDMEMMSAKTGEWFKTNQQRYASNNSAVLVRGQTPRDVFQRLFDNQKQFGEPGFFFVNANDPDVLTNPCCEIALNPKLVVTQREIKKLREYGYTGDLEEGMTLWGWQMCNLTTMAGSAATSAKEFYKLCRAAAALGTLQAHYTNVPFLGPVTRVINEREALIGVSICGVLDNPSLLLDPMVLRRGAAVVKATNAVIAEALGITRAARTTCVKPEGTSSLVLNSGSGIHPRHARRYFRRIQYNRSDKLFRHFKKINPHMCERSAYNEAADDVITFPVEVSPNALLKDDVPALRLLECVKLVQTHWVMAGRANATYTDAHHNVSNTINVTDEEWDDVAEYIWDHQDCFTGVAMLRADGDKTYKQAPHEALANQDDVRKWNSLVYAPVDYTEIEEKEDATAGHEHRGAATACAGGACSL